MGFAPQSAEQPPSSTPAASSRPAPTSTPGTPAAPAAFGTSTLFGVAPSAFQNAARGAAVPERAGGSGAVGSGGGATPSGLIPQHTLLGVLPRGVATSSRGAAAPDAPAVRADSWNSPGGSGSFEPVRTASSALGAAGAVRGAASSLLAGGTVADASSAPVSVQEAVLSPAAVSAPPLHARTHLGVALPGIAPLRATPPAPIGARPALRTELQLSETSLDPAAARGSLGRGPLPRSALVLLCAGIVLLASAAGFALLWNSPKALTASLGSDASGKDRLDITCPDCPDGSVLSFGPDSSEVHAQRASLSLAHPLPLGQNALHLELLRPDAKHAEAVAVRLPPLEYRIRPNTSSLSDDPPRLTLELEALPGTRAQIADVPVALDASGHGSSKIPVSGNLTGELGEVVSFEQTARYAITPPSGKE
ncbi:MAG TPA: hypothetical protein VG963_30565, partial [Polyangiaceae bacterium]|nr:hypothetical protein [Polyangiaceae bacterium]